MVLVEAQVHIWAADTPQRPWPSSGAPYAHRPEPRGKDELLQEMHTAGVDRVVIVPPAWKGDRNDLALQAARLPCPYRQAVTWFTLFTEELDFLSDSAQEWIMGRALAEWLGWPLSSA